METKKEYIERVGYKNLEKRKSFNTWDKDKLHEVSVKGGKARQKLRGEQKTAKECLERILPLLADEQILQSADIDQSIIERVKAESKDITLYELINLVAVGKAVDGNVKAIEVVRDTFGDKPKDKVDITAQSLTDEDRKLLEQVNERLNDKIADVTAADDK